MAEDILDRLVAACASHDPDRVAALFAPDYRSSMPAHPGREFVGRAQVLTNWTAVFDGVPDFTARLLARAAAGTTVWAEWEWAGNHTDGSRFAMRGVSVLVVRDDQVAEGRLYLEPVAEDESTIDEAVEELYQP